MTIVADIGVGRDEQEALLWAALSDPPVFAETVLGHDVWIKQAEILRAVRDNQMVAVKACHASSKTFTAAEAVIWWLCRFPDGMVITTAPTWNQVRRLIWPEIRGMIRGRIAGLEELTTELRNEANPGENYAMGLSTNQGVRFQGFHGRILIVVDEAPGVDEAIWEAIDGIMAGGHVHVLALGNPTIASGRFYDAFNSDAANWHTITIAAWDTPNLEGWTLDDILSADPDDPDFQADPVPYLTRRAWVRMMALRGVDEPGYQSRVDAEFPDDTEWSVYYQSWLDHARRDRDDDARPLEQVVVGVDVAGDGRDETVAYARQGHHILSWRSWDTGDARQAVAEFLNEFGRSLACVHVDTIGMGHYFAKWLEDEGFPVNYINVAERSAYKAPSKWSPGFANLKAELYWNLRDLLREGMITGLRDPETVKQARAIRYEMNQRRQVIEIESKKSLAERGVASPDRLEALILAFAPVPGHLGDLELPDMAKATILDALASS